MGNVETATMGEKIGQGGWEISPGDITVEERN